MTATWQPKKLAPVKGLHIRTLSDPRTAERIRVLDKYCLPVKYTDSYYDTYVRQGLHHFNQLAYFHDILVGCITCRVEKTDVEDVYRLYIMTITVLEPYRKLGIGSQLLERVLENVHSETHTKLSAVVLHMQVGSPVQEFYKKFGFEVIETVKDYYGDLEERNALLLSIVVPQPHLAGAHAKKSGK